MVNLVGPPMVPGEIYLTRLAGDRPGLVMLKPKKARRSSSAFGIIAIAQAISPFFFTEKSIKKLRREFAPHDAAGTVEKPVVASGGPETVEPPAGSLASPPVEPPVEPPAEPSADPQADPPVEPPADPPAEPPADPPADDPPAEPSNEPPAKPPDPPSDPPRDPPPESPSGPPPDPPPELPPDPPPDPPSQPPTAPPTNSPAGPPIELPSNPGAAVTTNHAKIQDLDIIPTCAHCGKVRSPSYQRRHPLAPGEIPKLGFCRNCAKKETSSEGSDDDNKRYRRKHRRHHQMPLGRETWAEYLGLTDKSYHPIVHTSRRRPSRSKKPSKGSNGKRQKKINAPKTPREATPSGAAGQKVSPEPVAIVRRTASVNGSSRAQSGGTPRASSMKHSTEKKAKDTSTTRLATSLGGRLPSPKPVRIVRRTTYVYQTKPSRAESDSRSRSQAKLIEKGVEELSIHNHEGEPGRLFSADLKPEEVNNGEGYDTEPENRRTTIRQMESLLVEPGTPQSTHLRQYFDHDRAPYAEPSHVSSVEGFSYRREPVHVEDLHRSRTRSVRLIRVGGEADSLFSSSSSTPTIPRGTELAPRPPSRSVRVFRVASDGLRSRPQSPRNDPPASESGRGSRPPSRSVRVVRVPLDGLRSLPQSPRNDPPASESGRGSRPPSRSVRVFRLTSDGLRSRPQSPRYDPPASDPGRESRPPSRSVRVLRTNADGLRSHPQSPRYDPPASERGWESRSPSRSVRVLHINPDELRSRPQSPRHDPPASEPGRESRPPSRSVHINPDGLRSRPECSTDDRAPSEPEPELRPPSRSISVIRVQPDMFHSRPQSPARSRTASKSDESSLTPRSDEIFRARPDGTYSRPTSAQAIQMATEPYGSRPPSRSVRALPIQPDGFRSRPQSPTTNPALSQPDLSPHHRAYRAIATTSNGAYSRPSSPRPMQSPTQSYGSQPPSRSDRKVRVSQDSIQPRSYSRDLRTPPVAAREPDEPRPRSSSVRIRGISNEFEHFTGEGNVSPDPRSSIRPPSRLPSPICGSHSREGENPPITRRKRTRYHGSESSSDSVSMLPPPNTHGSIHPSDSNTPHPLRILRMRHQSTYSDPEKGHPTDRQSAPVSPSGRVSGVRYVSPRAPTSRSLSRAYQPGYRDGAPATVSTYSPATGKRADGSSRIKYRPNEDWPASRETSPGSYQANPSGREKYRPGGGWPGSPEGSQSNYRIWRGSRANSQEKSENWGRSREHLPDRDYPDLSRRVSRSGRKKYRPNEDWPESPETSPQGSNKEWRESRARSQEKNEDRRGGGEEHLPGANEDWRGNRATSRPNSPVSNTQRSRAGSKSSGKWDGEAAAAAW